MEQKIATALYFHHSAEQIDESEVVQELVQFSKIIPEVAIVWQSPKNPLTNSKSFIREIIDLNIERLILVGTNAGIYQPFFTKVLRLAGKNQQNTDIFDFNEEGIFSSGDIAKAKASLLSHVLNISYKEVASNTEKITYKETVIIGAGIAGIQAALEIANSGHKVYLIEKTGTIGGHMAMFDKTFPTLDCAACILTPKMVDVGQHPNIKLLTLSEVIAIKGKAGDFTVKLIKHARRVNESTCIGCGTCAEKCPAKTLSEFDAGTTLRKAIYIPFPQAVPNKYLIDPQSCIYVQKGKCGACVKACPVEGCINLDEKDEEIEIKAGNIIVATGFQTFDARKTEQFGYGIFPNVVTSLEFERLVNAAGPTEGDIKYRQKDKYGNWVFSNHGSEPKKIAIIHCVGSRDENHHKYCSRVCCMYSLKLAHLIKEKMPKAAVSEFYIDMRAYGKGYEEFYDRIKEERITFIRGRTAKIEQKNGHLLLRSEDILNQKLLEQEADMVILAVGLESRQETRKLAGILGIDISKDGWLKESDSLGNNVMTNNHGIYIAGACQGPKDIPDSVVQGSAAAAKVLQSIISGTVKNSVAPNRVDTILTKEQELSESKEV